MLQMPNDGLQLRSAISIPAEGQRLREKHAIAPAAARLCWVAFESQALDFITMRIEKYQVPCSKRHVNISFARTFSFDRPHVR